MLGEFRDGEPIAELQLAGIEPIEHQIERHDLGERGWIARGVGVAGMEHLGGVHIDHDRGIFVRPGGRNRKNRQPCRSSGHPKR